MLNIFSCASWLSVCLLWWNVHLGFRPFRFPSIFWLGCFFVAGGFFFLLQWALWALYIFWNLIQLLVVSFVNIFSNSKVFFFYLVMFSFPFQKLLSFIKLHVFIFYFIFITLGGGSKGKILLQFMSECSAYVFLWVL